VVAWAAWRHRASKSAELAAVGENRRGVRDAKSGEYRYRGVGKNGVLRLAERRAAVAKKAARQRYPLAAAKLWRLVKCAGQTSAKITTLDARRGVGGGVENRTQNATNVAACYRPEDMRQPRRNGMGVTCRLLLAAAAGIRA